MTYTYTHLIGLRFGDIIDAISPERLKSIIDAQNVSQKELAELIGVTEVTMSRYVNGQRMPKAPILVKLAKELGVTVDWLMGRE